MGSIKRAVNYGVFEVETNINGQGKEAIDATAAFIAAAHNGAVLEMAQALTGKPVDKVSPNEIIKILDDNGIQMIKWVEGAPDDLLRLFPWGFGKAVPNDGLYFLKKSDNLIVGFISNEVVSCVNGVMKVKIYTWPA